MYENVIKKLRLKTKESMQFDINRFMIQNESDILELAKHRMKQGAGVNGGYIGSYYFNEYSYFKYTEVNPLAGGKVDLFLTGELYKGMRIIPYNGFSFKIMSNDWKYPMLSEKYGEEQFGLTSEQMKEVKEFAIEEVINKIYKSYE